MSDLLAARSQMGMSLAFHIIFAVVGVALPLMMTIAELLWHKTGDTAYLVLAKRWAKGTALHAVAVTACIPGPSMLVD
jgi:cytochrome d ubiquinol oxidase subunit I